MNKIVYLPTRYFPSISGAEFYFQRLAEILTDQKLYEIDIYTSNAIDFKALRSSKGRIINKDDKFHNMVHNLKIHRFPIDYNTPLEMQIQKLHKIKFFNNLHIPDTTLEKILQNGPYLPNLIEFFIKTKHSYDLIHTTYFPYFNLIIALILGQKINCPTICTPFFHFSNPRYLDYDLSLILSKFDKLIACTKMEKSVLKERLNISEDQIKVIPMGVDYEIYNNFSKKTSYSFKQKFLKKKDARKNKIVLFCGYKNYEKGAISILKAIPYILKKEKNITFVFIGPSTKAFDMELNNIRKSTNASILNFTPDNLTGYYDKKKISVFNESDVVVMPSRSDAFGIVFLEAWASETPVIGAKIGATPEVIDDEIDGLLVEFDNPTDIADKVIKLLQNNKLNRKLAETGRKKVKSEYRWSNIAKKTHLIYKNLINDTPI
ncbi:MAG: glycosyltransferase family 1 protein [Promethearchaeota archaeon]|nr:MAG: glycosyltransferase family 1 protein [Candidatus Lokiarchaeota archaeon]